MPLLVVLLVFLSLSCDLRDHAAPRAVPSDRVSDAANDLIANRAGRLGEAQRRLLEVAAPLIAGVREGLELGTVRRAEGTFEYERVGQGRGAHWRWVFVDVGGNREPISYALTAPWPGRGVAYVLPQAFIVIGCDPPSAEQRAAARAAPDAPAVVGAGTARGTRKNRGLSDIFSVCCDGLTGLSDAIGAAFPKAIVQTCIVHMLRASLRYVSYVDRKAMAKDLKPIYAAPTEEAAAAALEDFEARWGERYPGAAKAWRARWTEVVPFLQFPGPIRKLLYTTNAVESL